MMWLLGRLPRQAFELSAYTLNALTGNVYLRFLGLRTAAERALESDQEAEAEHLSAELLRLAEQFRDDWNYGNAVHHAHLLLGRIALRREQVDRAAEHLLLAGQTPGSPQLGSFGPNMSLAQEYLAAGAEPEVVLNYLDLCGRFWGTGSSSLDAMSQAKLVAWKKTVADGGIPDFGANLYY